MSTCRRDCYSSPVPCLSLPEGLRHEMEENGKLVQFIFRGDEVVAEETADNIIRLLRGYDLIASDAENARTYYHYASDEMGSITHVTAGVAKEGGNEEETPAGSILNHYEYDAWGNPTVCEETVENRFRFNGQQYDPVAQQYYLRARFYNPVIARFTQEDTYRGDGLNLYAYCKNNPVYYVDPSGHFCEKAAERICGLIDEGRIKGENREKLKSYLQERIDAGSITSWEQKVADKLGVGANSGGQGGSNTSVKGAINNGQPRENHQVVSDRSSLEATKQPPNSSADLLNPDGSVKQRRYYDSNGRAEMDIDYNHTDDGTHEFPHIHVWDWSKKPPRQDSR